VARRCPSPGFANQPAVIALHRSMAMTLWLPRTEADLAAVTTSLAAQM